MNKKGSMFRILIILAALGVIIAAFIGIFYSTNGNKFTVTNIYGDKVELYGSGIYAFNSIITVANRLGADLTSIIAAAFLIIFVLWKKEKLWTKIIQTSILIYITFDLASLVFEISMNCLYFLYIICFTIFLFISFKYIIDLLRSIEISDSLKNKRLTGTGIFLIIIGMITALLWISLIIPSISNNSYGSLLGIQITEVPFSIDLSITCPIYIMCGIWLLKKMDIGYKVAPLLLNVMSGIAVLTICQRAYYFKLGINIPIETLIAFIIYFISMGIVSLYLVIKLMKNLELKLK